MNFISISTRRYLAKIKLLGAELCSLVDKQSDEQYIWQADKAVWQGSAPILFPFVGRLKQGEYSHQGQTYPMSIHGFAKSSDFKVVAQQDDSVTLELQSTPETLKVYPFEFALQVCFTLQGDGLKVAYSVLNKGVSEMFFALGSHPAFRLPAKDMASAQASLKFDKSQGNSCYRLEGDLLSTQPEPAGLVANCLPLSADTFVRDALIFKNTDVTKVALYCNQEDKTGASRPRLTLETAGLPHLGIWAKPNAAYVCIEPWLATDESHATPSELSQKPDLIKLVAGSEYQTFYQIRI